MWVCKIEDTLGPNADARLTIPCSRSRSRNEVAHLHIICIIIMGIMGDKKRSAGDAHKSSSIPATPTQPTPRPHSFWGGFKSTSALLPAYGGSTGHLNTQQHQQHQQQQQQQQGQQHQLRPAVSMPLVSALPATSATSSAISGRHLRNSAPLPPTSGASGRSVSRMVKPSLIGLDTHTHTHTNATTSPFFFLLTFSRLFFFLNFFVNFWFNFIRFCVSFSEQIGEHDVERTLVVLLLLTTTTTTATKCR